MTEEIHLGPGDWIEFATYTVTAREAMVVQVHRAEKAEPTEGEHAFGDCAGSDCTGPHAEGETP